MISKILIGAKNSNGKYVLANDILVTELGYKKETDVVGRCAYDIGKEVFSESLEGSDVLVEGFLAIDEKAFRGEEIYQIYVHKWRGQIKFKMGHTFPFKNEKGKITVAMHTSYEISNPTIQQLKWYLANDEGNIVISEQSKKHIQWYIDELNNNFPLTPRELDCLLLLSTGKTAKLIAKQLRLSPRTVETYLDNAKKRLGCNNNYDLISIAFLRGWIGLSSI